MVGALFAIRGGRGLDDVVVRSEVVGGDTVGEVVVVVVGLGVENVSEEVEVEYVVVEEWLSGRLGADCVDVGELAVAGVAG